MRSSVDVAAIADPYTGYDIYETTLSWCTSGGTDGNGNHCPTSDPLWQTFGGTSLASPVIGAMWALAGGPGGVTYPSLSLYGHFKSDSSHPTYDVTVGGTGLCDWATPGFCTNNSNTNPNGWVAGQDVDCGWSTTNTSDPTYLTNRYQCYARPGYDGVSGVGTPKGLNAFKPMNPTAKISFSGTITHGVSKTFSGGNSTDPFPGGSITSYAWNWGDGHTSTGKVVSHTYSTKGTRTITLKVTDNYGRSNTKTITVTVA
jgi:PKD repeat protein